MDELYHQMTLDEWAASKNRIREMIRTAKAAFIVIGYELRKIEEAEAYRNDGYSTLAEFTQAEYGFDKTMTSRLIDVNKAFSEGGFSDILIDDAEGFSFSKLVEMKDLDKEDLQLLRPEVKREDIRELKKFEAEAPDGREGAEGIDELLVEFFRKRKEQLNEIFGRFRDGILSEETELAEIISPTGNVAFRKGMWMAFFYTDGITLKDRAGGVTKWTYEDLFCALSRIFGDAAAAGENTWETYYGEPVPGFMPEPAAEKQEQDPENVAEESKSVRKENESVRKEYESVRKEPESDKKEPESVASDAETDEGEDDLQEQDQGEKEDEHGRPEAHQGDHDGDTGCDGQGSAGDPEPESEEEQPKMPESDEQKVAPAQLGTASERRTVSGEVEKLATSIDEKMDALTTEIGSGRYAAALYTAQGLCKDLREILDAIKAKWK